MNEQLLKEILGELKTMKNEIQEVKTGQQKLETNIESLEKGQLRLETHIESLEKGQLRLETRIESEIIEKIGALFDGYTLRGDQIENLQKHLDQRFDSIETDTRYLVARVTRLEKLAK